MTARKNGKLNLVIGKRVQGDFQALSTMSRLCHAAFGRGIDLDISERRCRREERREQMPEESKNLT